MPNRPSRRTMAAVRSTQVFFEGLARAAGRTPMANPARHGVDRTAQVQYGPHGAANQLDIYRSTDAGPDAPCMVYVHGGGFRSLSKDTHWLMALAFARQGYVVFNVEYRLAPDHPYPAAAEDVCAAWLWVLDNAHRFGGDPGRIGIAGDSAGANLAAALTVAACYRRPEPWAAAVFEAGVVPRVQLPACGLFQVSDTERFSRAGQVSGVARRVVEHCTEVYLPEAHHRTAPGLADPVVVLETSAPDRLLPPAFLPVGTWDPLQHDTRRMAAALRARGGHAVDRYYPREVHAFHALIWRRRARVCWRDMLGFTSTHL